MPAQRDAQGRFLSTGRNTAQARRERSRATQVAMAAHVNSADIMRRLDKLSDKIQRKLLRSAIAAGLRAAVKEIKHEIPHNMKEARKAIGMTAKAKKGNVKAKVGAKVGKRKAGGSADDRTPGRPGVGIGVRNIHWFLMGTRSRHHDSSGKYVGLMDPYPAVKRGWRQAESVVSAKIKQSLSKGIEREAAKLAKGG